MKNMDLESVLSTFDVWANNPQGTQLTSARANVLNDVFFLNRAKGQCLNWRNLELIFNVDKEEVKKRFKKLTWPRHISAATSAVPDRDYTSSLPQKFIETEGRFKGIRWGLLIFTLALSKEKYYSKAALKAAAIEG